MEAMDWIEDEEAGDHRSPLQNVVRGWVPRNDYEADLILRGYLQELHGEEVQIAHHQKQIDDARQRIARMEANCEQRLRPYMQTVPCRVTKTSRKFTLASGTITIKVQGPEYKRDEDKLTAFLVGAQMDEYYEVVKPEPYYKPLWGKLKPLTETLADGSVVLRDSGEVLEGVRAIAREDKFEIG